MQEIANDQSLVSTLFETARLRVRELAYEDWKIIYENANNPLVNRHLSFVDLNKEAGARAYVQKSMLASLSPKRDSYKLAIARKQDQAFIGSCWIDAADRKGREASIGYFFLPVYWRSGFATEAVASLVDYAFNQLRFESLVANCERENIASQRVLERNGFALRESVSQFREDSFKPVEVLYFALNKRQAVPLLSALQISLVSK
jgi:RimJ/RimL family protein N-acetyltransferase